MQNLKLIAANSNVFVKKNYNPHESSYDGERLQRNCTIVPLILSSMHYFELASLNTDRVYWIGNIMLLALNNGDRHDSSTAMTSAMWP
jgi:hypothetical protein